MAAQNNLWELSKIRRVIEPFPLTLFALAKRVKLIENDFRQEVGW